MNCIKMYISSGFYELYIIYVHKMKFAADAKIDKFAELKIFSTKYDDNCFLQFSKNLQKYPGKKRD